NTKPKFTVIQNPNIVYQCSECDNQYTQKNHMYAHYKHEHRSNNLVPGRQQSIKPPNELQNNHIAEELKQLRQECQELREVVCSQYKIIAKKLNEPPSNITINHNGDTNINNGHIDNRQVINVNITAFGQENLSYITPERFMEIINSP